MGLLPASVVVVSIVGWARTESVADKERTSAVTAANIGVDRIEFFMFFSRQSW